MENNLTPFPTEDRVLSLMREYIASPLFDENTHVELHFEILGGEVGKQFSIDKLMRSGNRILIYGPPGSGKSETINYIRHKFAKRHLLDKKYPIPIYYLASRIEKDISLLNAISASNNLEKKEVLNYLDSGKSVLLLDEIDGVIASELPRVINEINKLAYRYQKSRIIVASRTLFLQKVCQLQSSFTIVSPLPLYDLQIQQYLQTRPPNFWRDIFFQIISTPWLRNIARSPLMVSLLAAQMARSSMQYLSGDPLRIIAQFIEAQISKPSYTQGHTFEEISIVIENIASYMNVHNRTFLNRNEISEISASRNLSQDIIETALNSGIFIEKSYDLLSFAHQSFYEFFLTKYIARVLSISIGDYDWHTEDVFGIRLRNVEKIEETLTKINKTIKSFAKGEVTKSILYPIYARDGSLEILFLIIGVASFLAVEFARGFIGKAGENFYEFATNEGAGGSDLPSEILDQLPSEIRNNPKKLAQFSRDFIKRLAENLADQYTKRPMEKAIIETTLEVTIGDNLEFTDPSKILGPPQRDIHFVPVLKKGHDKVICTLRTHS